MPSFGVTRRYGRRRLSQQTQNITIVSDPESAVTAGSGTETLKTFTLTPQMLRGSTYQAAQLYVVFEATGGAASATVNIEVDGVNSDTKGLDASPQYWEYTFPVNVVSYATNMTIKIESGGATGSAVRNARIEALVTSVI